MKNTLFRGAATAIITPFDRDGIDFEALARLIDFQIDGGIAALVVAGTTGENATLSDEEHRALVEFSAKHIAGRVPLITGIGSNDTAYALSLAEHALNCGVDGFLAVTPYYNKATQGGLIAHFTKIADEFRHPMVLYNVPSRTGCNLKPETINVLADHPAIVAVKEASGDLSQVASIAQLCGDRIDIYSGNDDQILPVLSLGGQGVISVLSNVLPGETNEMCQAFFRGDFDRAREMQLKYLPLIHDLFCEVNPIPVKAAMSAMGFCENTPRLPLTPMEEKNFARMAQEMKKLKLI